MTKVNKKLGKTDIRLVFAENDQKSGWVQCLDLKGCGSLLFWLTNDIIFLFKNHHSKKNSFDENKWPKR